MREGRYNMLSHGLLMNDRAIGDTCRIDVRWVICYPAYPMSSDMYVHHGSTTDGLQYAGMPDKRVCAGG